MILFKDEEREIFSIHINYRYAENHEISNEDFLNAHLAEHLIVIDACRQMQGRFGESSYIEKYVSGLTNIENSCFQLSASNEYIGHVNEFIRIICSHNLECISEEDFLEQVENVLMECKYPKNSHRGRCNTFFNFINDLEDINFEEKIHRITFDEIKKFIGARFVIDKCDIFYCGKNNGEIKREALLWAKHTRPKLINRNFSYIAKRKILALEEDEKNQVWFAYQFDRIQSAHDYFICEIVAKTIQIVIALSNKATIETTVANIGTHYTKKCAYALFSANTIYNHLCLDYSREMVLLIIESVKEEYKTRLLLKNDSVLEKTKFYKKLFYVAAADLTNMDIKLVFEKIKTEDVYGKFKEVYVNRNKIILEYIKDK